MRATSPSPQRFKVPLGRRLAQLACWMLALIGGLPLLLGLLMRTERVRTWADHQTSQLLKTELGVTATFRAAVTLWPLGLQVEAMQVPSNDGGPSALSVERVTLRPRLFALLAGQLDIGDVTVERPVARLVFRRGKLTNLNLRLPTAKSKAKRRATRAPFSTLAITEARATIDLDGRHIETGALDMDVDAEAGPSFDLVLRGARTTYSERIVEHYAGGDPDRVNVAEDILCELDLRARIEPQRATLRRFSLLGRADLDPNPGTVPSCAGFDNESDVGKVAMRLSQTRVDWSGPGPVVDGELVFRAPASLINRWVRFLPLTGWAGLSTKFHYDGAHRLPTATGKLRTAGVRLGRYRVGEYVDADFRIKDDKVLVPRARIDIANGRTLHEDVEISPFEPGIPFSERSVRTEGLNFPGLMRDLGVTDHTIVGWELGTTHMTQLKGGLAGPDFEGHIEADTHHFEVYDRGFDDPARKHMIGVPAAHIEGRLLIRPDAVEFRDAVSRFGRSHVRASRVSIGFHNTLDISVSPDSTLDLANISPITTIPIAGMAKLGVELHGTGSDPLLLGTLSIDDLVFGGFPLGTISSSKARFRPLKVELSELHAKKGQSDYYVKQARLDFDQNATIVVTADVQSKQLELHDFFGMWLMDKDPRYADILGAGSVDASLRYVLGGLEDRCGGGWLKVDGRTHLDRLDLFGEKFDSGDSSFGFLWSDFPAGFLGTTVEVASLTLRKGPGALLGSFRIAPGAELSGNLVGTAVPLSRLNGFGSFGALLDGTASGVAEVSGTLDAPLLDAQVTASPLRLGSQQLPASQLRVRLDSPPPKRNGVGRTHCGQAIVPPFDPVEYAADRSLGSFRIDGSLFGKQITLDELRVTRQRDKHLSGKVDVNGLDLGVLAEAVPATLLSGPRIKGRLSGQLQLDDVPLSNPGRAAGRFNLQELSIERGSMVAKLRPAAGPIEVNRGRLVVPGLLLTLGLEQGLAAELEVTGSVEKLGVHPEISANLRLKPLQLSRLQPWFPQASRLEGKLDGLLQIKGPLSRPITRGELAVSGGELILRSFEAPLSNIELKLAIKDNELRLERGEARVGSGNLRLRGSAPLNGTELGPVRLELLGTGLTLPEATGVSGTLDANIEASFDPRESKSRPRIIGELVLDNVLYSRPVTMSADVAQLAQRGHRSTVSSYDPADDKLDFDLVIRSRRPLKIHNGLVEAEMELDREGLALVGTNQRFGLRGTVRAKAGGRIQLRQHSFEIRSGEIRFDDATRIAPRVDVRATTEYRRYSNQTGSGTTAAAPTTGTPSGAGSTAGATGGRWKIEMHAHGDADQLKIDLTSDPAMPQTDIFLLLTVGVTRTELDQSQSASVGSSVALEALGTLSGADKAVTETIPLIDDFRFGSAYSSRTGRTEPTVTIGKRLAEQIRASVTSGLGGESREVRSNLEVRLNRQVSVEGSHANVNDTSSSQLGNLGLDVRWRVEFR